MGNRANVVLVYPHGGDTLPGTHIEAPAPQPVQHTLDGLCSLVYFYTHWDADDLASALAYSLDAPGARRRWDDTPYLSRIIIQGLLRHLGGVDWEEDPETGYGISTQQQDSNQPNIYVYLHQHTIGWMDRLYSYDDFIKTYKGVQTAFSH